MFEASRFLRLARSQWAEQGRGWLWFLAIVLMLHLTVLIIFLGSERGPLSLTEDTQGSLYGFGLFVLAPIFAGRYFLEMSRKESALLVLMRPASVFEKWLLAVLVVGIGFPLAFTATFYLLDVPAWALSQAAALESVREQHLAPKEAAALMARYVLFDPIGGREGLSGALQALVWMWMFQAFALFGSLWFRRMPFLKTLASGLVLWLLAILVAAWLGAQPGLLLDIWDTRRTLSPLQSWLFPLIWVAVPVLMIAASFFALKEREVVP